MLGWFKHKKETSPPASPPATQALLPSEVAWANGTAWPLPDWSQQPWPTNADAPQLHAHANALAATWLDATAAHLGDGSVRTESDHFMLLSALEPRPAQVLANYLERSRKRVLATLPGIAAEDGHGKTVVMVFASEETYYGYVSEYGNSSSEPEAFSGGMFIDAGYGHFVFAHSPFDQMEAVVVHELTHALVRHLPIPAWLNEGLAVNTEQRFVPSRSRYQPQQLAWMFSQFWNEATIQEFWSGKSFLRPDDGQPLSYELAKLLVQLVDKDDGRLARFCAAAQRHDGGEAAAAGVLGVRLGELASVVLGEGTWTPQPATWATGVEKGQF